MLFANPRDAHSVEARYRLKLHKACCAENRQ